MFRLHSCLIGLLTFCAPLAAAEPTPLFNDDFEKGPSPQWLSVAPGAKVVPEDADKPDGNHVLRLLTGQRLIGPPVRTGDLKGAAAKSAELDRWQDYELSFRFRLGQKLKLDFPGNANSATVFSIGWRINPHEDSPQEKQLMFMHVWRSYRKPNTWYLQGPLAVKATKNVAFDPARTLEKKELEGELDTNWHTWKVRVRGEETAIWLDDRLAFRGTDDTAPRGGFMISTEWNLRDIDPGYLDIDAVRVVPLEAATTQEAKP